MSRDSLGVRTWQWLRAEILEGRLPLGQRVNEVALAQELGLSRGPVREALQRLASEGLVELIAQRGAFVRAFSGQELVDIYEVRIALEVAAGRLAAERRDAGDIAALESSLALAAKAVETGEGHYPPDLDLHRLIAQAAKNPELLRLVNQVNQQIQLARARSGYQPQRAHRAFREHSRIVKAVVDGKPEAAAVAMQRHLEHSLQSIRALFSLGAGRGRQ